MILTVVAGTEAEVAAAQTDERNLIVTAFDKNNIVVTNDGWW